MDEITKQVKGESGFFPVRRQSVCSHPEHRMPTHLYIAAGYGYRHICPACGAESTAYGADYRFDAA